MDLFIPHVVAAMLREHGTQRPTVFELLDQVHRVRGTKSRFTYHKPPPQPLSPRVVQHYPANTLDNVVSIRPKSSNTQIQPTERKDATPVVPRDKALEATTTPVRRGRPSSSHQKESTLSVRSHPPSPTVMPPGTAKAANRDLLADEEDKAWKALRASAQGTGDVKVQKSGGVGWSAWKPKNIPHSGMGEISPASRSTEPGPRTPTTAFSDNFSWHAGDSTKTGSGAGAPSTAKGKLIPSKLAPSPLEGSRTTKVVSRGKDAFDGLGLPTVVSQAPTLGEARKLRTGLATIGDYHRPSMTPNPSLTAAKSSSPGFRPTPPRSHASSSWGSSPSIQPIPLTAAKPVEPPQLHNMSAESRFPSLEELDATFAPVANPSHSFFEKKSNVSEMPVLPHPRSQLLTQSSVPQRNARSEQNTDTAMRDMITGQRFVPLEEVDAPFPKRPSLLAQTPLSFTGQHAARSHAQSLIQQSPGLLDIASTSVSTLLPTRSIQETRDWLTGEIDSELSPKERDLVDNIPGTPVLREFTKKRSSFIEENTAHIPSPQEGITGRQPPLRVLTPPSPGKTPSRRPQSDERELRTSDVFFTSRKEPDILSRTSVLGATKPLSRRSLATELVAPPVEKLAESWRTPPVSQEGKSSSSDEESPEGVLGIVPSKLTGGGSVRRRRGRQSSVHDLVDLWGGGVVQTKERLKEVTQDSVTPIRGASQDVDANLLKNSTIAFPSTMKPSASSPRYIQARPSQSSGSAELPRPPSRTSDQRRSPASHTKQLSNFNSSIPPAPPPTHARPQSLLLFPMTKSNSDQDAPSTPGGLSVPQDGSRKNGARRTSITDMVQRYEAINASVKTGGQGTSLPKSPSLKLGPQITPSVTPSRPTQSIHSPSVSRFNSSQHAEDLSPNKDTDKRVSATGLTTAGSTDVTGLPNGSSSKLLSSSTSGRLGLIDGLPSASVANKVTAPPEEQRRSPSPEKPYRGVGKLIDQWQKKSEEAESARNQVPRRGYVAKRAGLV